MDTDQAQTQDHANPKHDIVEEFAFFHPGYLLGRREWNLQHHEEERVTPGFPRYRPHNCEGPLVRTSSKVVKEPRLTQFVCKGTDQECDNCCHRP